MSRDDQESIDKMLKEYRETHEQNKLVKNPKGLRKNASKNEKDNSLLEISKGLAPNHDQFIEASNYYSFLQKNNGNSFKKFISRKETQEIKNLFKNFTFVFIPDKFELSQKRIEILQNQIILNQGMIYDFFRDIVSLENFHKNHHEKHHFIITSKNTLYEECFRYLCQFGLEIRGKNLYFVDFEWISECLKLNKIIDPNIYRKFVQYSDGKKISLPNINVYKHKDSNVLFNIEENLILENLNKDKSNIEENLNLQIENSKSSLLLPINRDSRIISEETNKEIDEQKNPESESINNKTDPVGINENNINDLNTEMEIEIIENQQQKLQEIKNFDFSFFYDYNYVEYDISEIKPEKIEEEDQKTSNFFTINQNDDDEEDVRIISSSKSVKIHDSIETKNGTIFEGIECELILPDVKQDKLLNPGRIRNEKYWNSKKNNFFCATGIPKTNQNTFITNELDKLLKFYSNERDKGRMIAYKKAIGVLKCQQKPIESLEDIENLPSIGMKMRKKIEEILETGSLRKAQYDNIHNKSIEELSGVWGIGPTTAEKLYFKGIKTIEELRKNQNLLNDNQKIGLKYYEELKIRIPRDEIEKVCKIVKDRIEKIADTKNSYEMIPCGSYRRGKATCGDIDILITRIDGGEYHGFLHQLMKSLEKTLLTDHLSYPRYHSERHESETYMGIYQLEENLPHRRIDIKIYPRSEFGYAVLYFTGSDYFNRSMRLFARKKGYSLSDKGLFPAFRVRNQKVWEGQNIPCYTEEEVFKVLGLEYRYPEERDV